MNERRGGRAAGLGGARRGAAAAPGWASGRASRAEGLGGAAPARAVPHPPLRQNGVEEQESEGCAGRRTVKIHHSPSARAS